MVRRDLARAGAWVLTGALLLGAAPPARRKGVVTMRGEPVTLLGPELAVGDAAPDFRLTDTALRPKTLQDYAGTIKIISAVPSLDTGVCSLETRRFNELAAQLRGVVILTVSMDLPFAQKRWCGAHGIDRVITLSDYKDHAFGLRYGVLMEESALLARAVFVVDQRDIIRYVQRVPELGLEPDYQAVLAAVRRLQGTTKPAPVAGGTG